MSDFRCSHAVAPCANKHKTQSTTEANENVLHIDSWNKMYNKIFDLTFDLMMALDEVSRFTYYEQVQTKTSISETLIYTFSF